MSEKAVLRNFIKMIPSGEGTSQFCLRSLSIRQLDCLSRKSEHSVRLRVAHGAAGAISSNMHIATAFALRWSGHEQMMFFDEIISCIDIVIAREGTSSIFLNQPSPTCCLLDLLSSSTIIYGSVVSRSAGGSLNARWPFSPMHMNVTSRG